MNYFFHRTRYNYWSCSKFADFVRKIFGVPVKLNCGTAEEWVEWTKTSKITSKFIHWFTEEFLNKAQNFVNFPSDVLYSVRVYLSNRFMTKTHMAPTNLQKGQWHETDTRMLHSMFGLLVDFIEIEKSSQSGWLEDAPKLSFMQKVKEKFNIFSSRDPEKGIKYLEWEMTLKHDDPNMCDETDPDWGKPTRQAKSACEQMDLYLWWTEVRPFRPDPMDLSGYRELNNYDGGDIMEFMARPMPDSTRVAMNIADDIEQAQEAEDTEMLVRLIKLRSYLWT